MKNTLLLLVLLGLYGQSSAQSCSKASAYRFLRNERTAIESGVLQQLNAYDVHYYKIDLAVERDTKFIAGATTLRAKILQAPMNQWVFSLGLELSIDSIKVDGNLQNNYTRSDTFVTVQLDNPLLPGLSDLQVHYHGEPEAGLYNSTEPYRGEGVTWTLSEPYNAFHWFAVKQLLSDKADSSEVWITTSRENKAGSNGLLIETVNLPDDKVQYRWKSRYPIAYYLPSLTVGKFAEYTLYAHPAGASQPVPIVNYIYDDPQALADWQSEMDKTADMIDVFSDWFGLYPFHEEKYGHCTAPIGGGMEHQTMTTQSTFITGLTAHELAHQWFGDQVTCGSWKDIWLNEGFASYCEYLYHQTDLESNAIAWLDNAYQVATSSPSGSVYVDDTADAARVFDARLSYKKAGLLLHMLRHRIDDDALFLQGLKNYQESFKHRTATTADFKLSMELTTGMNLTTFFNQWYFGSGFPTVSAEWNHSDDGNLYLKISQTASDATHTPKFDFPLECLIQRNGAPDTLVHVFVSDAENYYSFPAVQGETTGLVIDPDRWLLHLQGSITQNPSLVVTSQAHAASTTEIILYPNPAKDEVHLLSDRPALNPFTVYHASGKMVFQGTLSKGAVTLYTAKWTKGLYHVVFSTGKALSFIKE